MSSHRHMAGQRPRSDPKSAPLDFWQEPHFRVMQAKIGQDLGVLLRPPKELPHRMLTMILQIGERPEGIAGTKKSPVHGDGT